MTPSDADLRLAIQLRMWAKLANQWADTIERGGSRTSELSPPDIPNPGARTVGASIPSAIVPPAPGTFSRRSYLDVLLGRHKA